MLRARWPAIRAALITAVILSHGLVSIPWGPRITAESLAKPGPQEEVSRWMDLVRALHLPIDRPTFEQLVIDGSDLIITWDRWLTSPIKPVLRFTQTGQAWALFATPDSHPHAIHIAGRAESDDEWELLYGRFDREHTLLGSQISFRRIRGVYDGQSTKPGRLYRNLCRWLAREVFERRADLDEVKVYMVRQHTLPPWLPPDPETSIENVRVIKRSSI